MRAVHDLVTDLERDDAVWLTRDYMKRPYLSADAAAENAQKELDHLVTDMYGVLARAEAAAAFDSQLTGASQHQFYTHTDPTVMDRHHRIEKIGYDARRFVKEHLTCVEGLIRSRHSASKRDVLKAIPKEAYKLQEWKKELEAIEWAQVRVLR